MSKVTALQATRKRGKIAVPSADALLAWYDRHRRVLPWRAPPGKVSDPYHVWLSEIMLQQTAVKTVGPYFERFLRRFPTVEDLAAASLDDVLRLWSGLGYYARARNLHACAKTVAGKCAGRFPDSESGLRELPGIGPYTAAAIAAIAFDRRTSPVDGNIERVVSRLFAIEEPLPSAKPVIRGHAESLTPARRAGDFAQAMMDLGATICTPKGPACVLCPWNEPCVARARGDADTFPRKSAKTTGELRRGAAYVVVRADGSVLTRRRPERGLLGGLIEVPTTDWSAAFVESEHDAPVVAQWTRRPGAVRHVFTHFPLELTVYTACVDARAKAPPGTRYVPSHELGGEALSTLMRKVLMHADIHGALSGEMTTGSSRKMRPVKPRAMRTADRQKEDVE
jgi:A/G-specific adenine glycosylase